MFINNLKETNTMINPEELFGILDKISGKDKPLTQLAGTNFNDIFKTRPNNYKKIINNAKNIAKRDNAFEEMTAFLKGIVLTKPYVTKDFLNIIEKASQDQFKGVTTSINHWLDKKFSIIHKDLYEKLSTFEMDETVNSTRIISSKNPTQIKEYVDKTGACINDDPLQFFDQIARDPATIYLLAKSNSEKEDFSSMQKRKPDIGYARIYAYQSKDKQEKVLAVDNVWVNNGNKQIIFDMVSGMANIAKYLGIEVIDKVMIRSFLISHPEKADIYDQEMPLYKLGHTPLINRYCQSCIPVENDGFYILKKN